MPGVQVGVYPGQLDAGTQVSSTGEGRHLTVREDELIHPYHADGFVDKGDPVVLCDAGVPTTYGRAVGVAFVAGSAAADWIAVDTEGIWNLTVYAEDDDGNSAIEIGDPLYIRAGGLAGAATGDGTGDAEISKIRNLVTQVPFGYALGSMVAGGSGRIAVKVHWDPRQPQDEVVNLTGADADNAMSLAVNDAGTPSANYQRGFYVNYISTGIKTGTAEINAIGADMSIRANVAGSVYCVSLYIEQSGDPTVGNDISGLYMYLNSMGAATYSGTYNCLDLNIDSTTKATGGNNGIRFYGHGAAADHILTILGNGATYLVNFASNATAPIAVNTHAIDGHALSGIISVSVAGAVHGYIPVFAAVPA
jgi:hypothetical protein